MSITDELREYAEDWDWLDTGAEIAQDRIEAIADRIDAEHEESMQREHESAYDVGYVEGMGVANKADMRAEYLRGKNDGYDEGFASADDWLAQHEDAMSEHGWIRLPKDADGEPIHIGDEVEEVDYDGHASVFEVRMTADGWWVCAGGICRRPDRYRHYHASTVEDVLTEFGIDWEHESDCEDRAALLKEYASKLRLAEGEDA